MAGSIVKKGEEGREEGGKEERNRVSSLDGPGLRGGGGGKEGGREGGGAVGGGGGGEKKEDSKRLVGTLESLFKKLSPPRPEGGKEKEKKMKAQKENQEGGSSTPSPPRGKGVSPPRKVDTR